MRLLFLMDCTIQAYYRWTCGDGCCFGEEPDDLFFTAGEILTLTPSGYRSGDYELTGKYHDIDCVANNEPYYIYKSSLVWWLEDEFCKIIDKDMR